MRLNKIPNEKVGYIEILITILRQPRFKIIDLIIVVLSVVHSYHPDITGQVIIQYQDMRETNTSFEVNHIDL